MKIEGLKILSKEQIEQKADEIISAWFPYVFEKPRAFPLNRFCEKIETEYKIRVELEANLNPSATGEKVLGCFQLDPKCIFIDRDLKGDPRFAFVLAHEIGHLILHRHIQFSKAQLESMKDTKKAFGKKILATDYDWIEWQANTFAANLLLPEKTFRWGLGIAQKAAGVNKLGRIYIKATKDSRIDFYKTVEGMAKIFRVSKASIEYRLREFNLIDYDTAGRGTSILYEILEDNGYL